MADPPHGQSSKSLQRVPRARPSHAAGRDVGTQVDEPAVPEPSTPVKRVRFTDNDDGEHTDSYPVPKRLALELHSPTGTKIVHIDPQSYVTQPFDLITDPYISKFMTYNKSEGIWFPIALVPEHQSWVVVDENPLVMHRANNGKAMMVWIVGSFVSLSLHQPLPAMHSTLQVTVDLLREYDRSRLIAIHNSTATVPMKQINTLKVCTPESDDYGPPPTQSPATPP
ncbi:hypothetical protein L226DRAFT_574645 [Lentinus tigrinus ALCF2SS1-7]|uniref:Uncharacterized protein n=1 Tax=Lentinus tigrinus ALCF2SS1-6 TaxID=1328759 RepID=A0A5C2RRI4_9APHY|nr:hypothetical protein L227DRAFT_616755 [Lentinus tigrinus ALCF2SS1-6]RPD70535.1 hypothetical protein L226DRAFT_574645 [Lentinus tigrinus ALCF2SS1-7]